MPAVNKKLNSARLRKLREKAGQTQTDVFNATGIHATDISAYERGVKTPTAVRVGILAEHFGVDVESLYSSNSSGGKSQKHAEEKVNVAAVIQDSKEMLEKLSQEEKPAPNPVEPDESVVEEIMSHPMEGRDLTIPVDSDSIHVTVLDKFENSDLLMKIGTKFYTAVLTEL